jgi:putative PEP-CTERM system TPR-repeat lipoprotein
MSQFNLARWGALCALALLLQGCGKSEADLIGEARSHLEKKDTKAAAIQLKTVLQKNPQSGEARYLLGKALLENGDAVAAGVELQKAADLKHDITLVLPLLAKALLDQGEHKKVIEQFGTFSLPEAKAQSDLKTTLGIAYARQGNRPMAEQAIRAALIAAPDHVPALIARARMAADDRDFARARRVVDEALERQSTSHDGWMLKGDLALIEERDKAAAIAAYRKALAAKPDLVSAHKGIITLLLADRDLDGATAQLAVMKKALPNNPQTIFFEGQIAFMKKDYKAAQGFAQRLLQAAPTNPLVLQLAGTVEYYLRNYTQAEVLLNKAVGAAPQLPLARMVLAQTYLRTGQPAKTISTLEPLIEHADAPAEALALAAEAHLVAGDPKMSDQLFARATKAKPDDPKIRTVRAMSQLHRGNADAALSELETVAGGDSGTVADMALISAHLRRSDFDKALKAIDALEKKQPDKPVAANLRGRVLALKKDNAGARQNFERALKIDPKYFPAVSSLAAMDLIEKGPAEARKRFDKVLETDPKNSQALLATANLLARTGAPKEQIADYLGRAIAAAPSQTPPRLLLIDHHLRQKDYKSALQAAQDGLAAQPTNGELLHAQGRIELAGGNPQQAITTFNKLMQQQPESPIAPMALAEAYLSTRDLDNAVKHFKKSLALKPDLLAAQRGLIGIAVSEQRYTDATDIAKTVQKQRADNPIGWMLEGDIETSRRRWDAAAAAYRGGLQKAPSSEVAVRLHRVLLEGGKAAEADRHAADWQKQHPKDSLFMFHLGDVALGKQDWPAAETRYRAVLAVAPDNVLALNNVAYLLVKQGKPGAVPLAEKANQLAPNRAPLLDTLALALAADKQIERALEAQRKAVELAPAEHGLRLNLARFLIQNGDKSAAKTELQALEKLGPAFGERETVMKLLASVNS